MKIVNFLFYFVILHHIGFSQNIISGTVNDNTTQQAIPFPSVGIAGTHLGTIGDANGKFELSIKNFSDTLRISSIGYSNLLLTGNELKTNFGKTVYLKPEAYNLNEVQVRAKKLNYITLGTDNYSKNICTAFIGENANWRGEQAAIRANNKETDTAYLESFGFYIIKNDYIDSLQFRLMLYTVDTTGFPGKTFLKKPILFKTNVKQGEVRVDLKNYFIKTPSDFFISLECLEQKMEMSKFCFAGSIKVPSFVKPSAFGKWTRVKGGGGDFNIKVSYAK